jgi:hypothetical protein
MLHLCGPKAERDRGRDPSATRWLAGSLGRQRKADIMFRGRSFATPAKPSIHHHRQRPSPAWSIHNTTIHASVAHTPALRFP